MCRTIRYTTKVIHRSAVNHAHVPFNRGKISVPDAGGGKIRKARNAGCTSSTASSSESNQWLHKVPDNLLDNIMNTAVEKLFLDNASNRHLDWLESEAIHIMREVAAECTNPAL